MTVTTGTLALAGNFATTGAFATTLIAGATTSLTLPLTSATLARTDAAQTFTGIQTFSTPIAASSVATMTATVGGRVPTPPNNTTTFLRGDGSWATVTTGITALTGVVTASGTGSVVTSFAAGPSFTGGVSVDISGLTSAGYVTAPKFTTVNGGSAYTGGGYVNLFTPTYGSIQLVVATFGNSQTGMCIVVYGPYGGAYIAFQQLQNTGVVFQMSGGTVQAARGDMGAATFNLTYTSLC